MPGRRRGRRVVRTAAVVGTTAHVVGKNKDKQAANEAEAATAANEQQVTQKDPMAELQKLGDLHKQGILTDEEFETKKAVLLKQI